jgi:hypothetical protein
MPDNFMTFIKLINLSLIPAGFLFLAGVLMAVVELVPVKEKR